MKRIRRRQPLDHVFSGPSKKTRCSYFPRCQEIIDTEHATIYTDKGGKDILFCSHACLRRFMGMPDGA